VVLPSFTLTKTAGYGFLGAGDDSLALWVNGIATGRFASCSLFVNGTNVIAALVKNGAYGGGYLGAMARCTSSMMVFPSQYDSLGDTIGWDTLYDTTYYQDGEPITDTNWTYSFGTTNNGPISGWETSNFNDASWLKVDSFGDVHDTRQKYGPFDTNCTAKWVFYHRTLYYRKAFTSPAADTAILRFCSWNSMGVSIAQVYLNGVKILDSSKLQDTVTIWTGFCECTTTVNAGDNVLAFSVRDTTRGDGMEYAFDFRVPKDSIWIFSDSTWKCYDREEPGWNTTSYTNEAAWYSTGVAGNLFLLNNFMKTWGTPAMADTTFYDTLKRDSIVVFVSADSSMTFYDTMHIPDTTQITHRDTTVQVFRPSKSVWLYAPRCVYMRYKFNLTLQ
jgi:hypothetical protein